MANNITNLTVRTYDEYLVKKIESVIMTDEQNKPLIPVVYSPFDLAFEYAMKRQQVQDKNKVRFPLIICHRSAGFTLSDTNHRLLGTKLPVYYLHYLNSENVEISRYFQRINVDIPYSIEILTKDENQAFELAQEIMFLLIREPFLEVPQFIQGADVPTAHKNDIFRFAVIMDNEIADNTALETEPDAGKLYRLTLSVVINDAMLSRDVSTNLITSSTIVINYYDSENGNLVIQDEVHIE